MLTFQKKIYNPAEEITLHAWRVTRHKEVIAGSLMGGTNPENQRAPEQNSDISLWGYERMHEEVWFGLEDRLLFDAEVVKLDLCGIIIVYKINSFTQTAFLFLPQIPFWIDWTSIWHLLIRPDLLLRMAFNCSFLRLSLAS